MLSVSSNPSEEQVYDLGSGEPLLPASRSDRHWSEGPGWSADTQVALCTRLWAEPCRRWVVDVIGEALQLQTPIRGAYTQEAGMDDFPSGHTAAASRRSLWNMKITAMTSATTWQSHTGLVEPKSPGAIFRQLSRQHLILLCLIAYHSLSTPEDLAAIAGLGLGRLERLLARLRKMKLALHLTLPIAARGLPTARWEPDRQAAVDAHSQTLKALYISPLGSQLLGAMYRLPSAHLPFARSRWEKHLVHDVGVRRLLGLLLQQASEVSRLTSEADGGGGTRGISVAVTWWTNAPDVALRFMTAGETTTIFPDAAGEIGWRRWTQRPPALIAAAGRLRFWVEWDQGSMNTRDLWDKLLMYQRYAAFCSAASHDGPDEQYGWQVPDTPPGETSGLPVLVFVTQDERQEQRVLRILAGLSSRKITDAGEPSGRLNVRLSTVDRLSQKGPLGDCWQTSSLAY